MTRKRSKVEGCYDYIVVGGGSAGCAAAGRLVQRYGVRVLLLEGGPGNNDRLIRMPAGSFKIIFSDSPYVKRYASCPQSGLNGRVVQIVQGTVIGGGSSVNVMAYTRGSRLDYDRWDEATGHAGWTWQDLLPYFRRQEGNRRLHDVAHGNDGPLKVSDPLYVVRSSDVFVRTMQRLGLPYRDDFNAGDLNGVGYLQTTIGNAERCSAADAFLTPLAHDRRLTIVTGAQVTRIRFDGRRAIGVDYLAGGTAHQVATSAEIILTAGAFATPKLLMLSGIGPADHLREHGIPVAVDSPGVGENLQDHNTALLTATTNGPFGYHGQDRGLRMLRNAFRYFAFRNGPVASNGSETMAFLNLGNPDADPDIQLYCLGVMWPFPKGGPPTHGITLMANLVKPLSRGRVRLRSSDPLADPIIDPNWMSESRDSERLLVALHYLRRILDTEPLAGIIGEERLPGPALHSDEDLLDYIRSTTESNYHPVGTCRMGRADDPMAVLTPDLCVRGTEALRVFDASMMPNIISANTNAPVMAVAERGVDLMMGAEA